MNGELVCGSLFSGVGGMDIGFAWAGWRHAFFAEIEPFGRAVLAERFPDVPIYSDVRDVPECERGEWDRLDVLTFGSPCQDLSVAGKRRGLDGDRSGLFWEAMRIAGDGPFRPRALLMENVEGLLSSNGGRDFALVLDAMAERGYRWSYRVLDSQHFGVPQRRRRVFVVAIADDDPRAERIGEVLALAEGGGGDSPTSEPSWPDVAARIGAGAPSSSGDGAMTTHTHTHTQRIAPAVTAKWAKGSGGPAGDECQNLVTRAEWSGLSQRPTGSSRDKTSARVEPDSSTPGTREREREREERRERDHAADASTPRRQDRPGRPLDRGGEVVSALQGGGERGYRVDAEAAAGGQLIPVEVSSPNAATPEVAGTMQAPTEGSRTTELGPAFVYRKSACVSGPDTPETWVDDGVANTLNSFDVGDVRTTHAVVQTVGGDVTHTLTGEGHDASEDGTGRGTPVIAFPSTGGSMGINVDHDRLAPTLRVGSGLGIPSPPAVAQGPAVRRLTPMECERLQGWPDGWTDIPWNGKPHAPDSKRYAAAGNGVTAPVAYWIAARLAEVLK